MSPRQRWSARAVAGLRVDPTQVVAGLSDDRGVCLNGKWAGGSAIVADEPIALCVDDGFPTLDLPWTVDEPGDAVVGGGWFGWMSFDGRSHWALYPNVLRYDQSSGQWMDEALHGLVSESELEQRRNRLCERVSSAARPTPYVISRPTASMQQAEYEDAVRTTIEHIRAGNVYQANVCLAVISEFCGSPAAMYRDLLSLQPAFGAYLAHRDGAVVSASPELFLRRVGRRVRSSPIKGTRPRSALASESAEQAADLRTSTKERAENIMIVDLMRNDLSRVAVTGSVEVASLLRLEEHPGVWHLVSDVVAELRGDVTDADLLRATFPPGSVTGAPKSRALEMIAEVETSPRGVYTGAIGYVSPLAGLELSVAIRTFEVTGEVARLGVGAGITIGSDPGDEWRECQAKAAPLLAVLNTDQ